MPELTRSNGRCCRIFNALVFLLFAAQTAMADQESVWVRAQGLPDAERHGLHDYGSYAWGEAAPENLPALRATASRVQVIDNPFELRLGGLRFDPLTGFPQLESTDQHAPTAGPNFHLIQFQGPIRGEWLQGVRNQGIRIVQYIHPYTYVVWGDAAQLNATRGVGGVRWTGEFAPEFRVLPDQRGHGVETVATMALISRHADESDVRRKLESAGAVVHTITPVTAHTAVAQLDVPGNRYMEIGSIPAVYTVQYITQDAGPRSELSNQAIVNSQYATNQDVLPGYIDWLNDNGYDGSGVIVGIVDGGVRETHEDLVDNIAPCVDSGVTPNSCTGATGNINHGTHVAGAVAGTGATGTTDAAGFLRGQGVAPGAKVVQQRYPSFLGAGPGGMIADAMLTISRETALSGALLSNNSWGPSGSPQGYNIPTQQVDMITRDADPDQAGHQPVLPVWSIMNGGGDSSGACAPSSLGAPDEAKNLFGIGSSELIPGNYPGGTIPNPSDLFSVSYNSAHGPTCDGRTGLHIVAPGCGTDSATAASDTSYSDGFCGTSMASPIVSGAVSVFIERYRDLHDGTDPSPALIKAAVTAVAMNLHGFNNADGGEITETPSRFQGYGRIDLDAVVNPPNNVLFFDQEQVFNTSGEEWTMALTPEDPDEPVRLMLMWTDAHGHGMGGETPAWVNNLDLEVEVGADAFFGNVLGEDGFSETGGGADAINNAEAVFLRADQHSGGALTVTVRAENISADALNPYDQGDPAQDFALVCYNCIAGDPDPAFTLGIEPETASACVPAEDSESVAIEITVDTMGEYEGMVNLAAAGEPSGVTSELDPKSVEPPGNVQWTLTIDETVQHGEYDIELHADDGEQSETLPFALTLDARPALVELITPKTGTGGVESMPEFTWQAADDAMDYRLQLATDPAFSDPLVDETLTDTAITPAADLDEGVTYYWRVSAANDCGEGTWSQTYDFTTASDAVLAVAPDQVDFGTVEVGQSDQAQVQVSNGGAAGSAPDLVLSDFAVVGAPEFAISKDSDCEVDGEPLAGGRSCSLVVGFTPAADGKISAVLVVDSEDGQTKTVLLSGTGGKVEPPLDEVFRDRFEPDTK